MAAPFLCAHQYEASLDCLTRNLGYYCWEVMVDGERRRQRSYIPANQCREISAMVSAGKPAAEIAASIRKRGGVHHWEPTL
jgi:hypothetical protein